MALHSWPKVKDEYNNFPTEWIPFWKDNPVVHSKVIVYSPEGGVQFGYASTARAGKGWRTEYICVRKTQKSNAPILKGLTLWCYAPTV